jgi:hypothetical protein
MALFNTHEKFVGFLLAPLIHRSNGSCSMTANYHDDFALLRFILETLYCVRKNAGFTMMILRSCGLFGHHCFESAKM